MEAQDKGNTMRTGFRAFFIIVIALAMIGCGQRAGGEKVLLDFESDGDLDRIDWRCQILFTLSEEHVTHGARSLRMELYPSEYPGLSPKMAIHDWRGYVALCFDVYNPQAETRTLSVRIDDRKDYPTYEERFNARFLLEPGRNSVRIPLRELVTSGVGGPLDLGGIQRLVIFVARPDGVIVLYLDHLRLEPERPHSSQRPGISPDPLSAS